MEDSEKTSAPTKPTLERLQRAVDSVFGTHLWSAHTLRGVAEVLQGIEAPCLTFCHFLYSFHRQEPIMALAYVTSEGIIGSYRTYLHSLHQSTPGRAAAELADIEYRLKLSIRPEEVFEGEACSAGPLIKFALCSSMGRLDIAERFREGAEKELGRNPYWFEVLEELRPYYPLTFEEICHGGKN